MFRCNYPEDFHNCSNAVNVSIREINEWIDQCIKQLEGNPDIQSTTISSGNTKVIIMRMDDDYMPYDITVCKGYEEYAPYMNSKD